MHLSILFPASFLQFASNLLQNKSRFFFALIIMSVNCFVRFLFNWVDEFAILRHRELRNGFQDSIHFVKVVNLKCWFFKYLQDLLMVVLFRDALVANRQIRLILTNR
jgi:hypothetical protein